MINFCELNLIILTVIILKTDNKKFIQLHFTVSTKPVSLWLPLYTHTIIVEPFYLALWVATCYHKAFFTYLAITVFLVITNRYTGVFQLLSQYLRKNVN